MYKKLLLPVLLTCILSTLGLAENMSFKAFEIVDVPPKAAYFVIGNWNNHMDPNGCVLLDQGNYLKITGVISVGTNDLSAYPPMYVRTQFGNNAPWISPDPIDGADLVPLELLNGQIVYTYTIEGFTGDFVDHCNATPDVPLPFDYEISAVDEFGNLYPIEDYPDLLIPQSEPHPGMDDTQIIYATSSYAGTKDLCCYGTSGNMGEERSIQSGDENIQFEQSNVFPNPFSTVLNVQFKLASLETTIIQLWDVNGRMVRHMEYIPEAKGIQEAQIDAKSLSEGFYYCRIKNTQESETFKVLKLNN